MGNLSKKSYVLPWGQKAKDAYLQRRGLQGEKGGDRIREIIMGVMLGDGHAERRGGKTRLTIKQGENHRDYLMWLHKEFSKAGFCNERKPERREYRNKEGKYMDIGSLIHIQVRD